MSTHVRSSIYDLAVCALCHFLTVPWVCLWYVIVAFPGHTHLVFVNTLKPFRNGSSTQEDAVFFDFSPTVKAVPHECVIRTGQPAT